MVAADRRAKQAELMRKQRAEARDIEIPRVKSQIRKNKCRLDLVRFTGTYFSRPVDEENLPGERGLACLPLSELHVMILRDLQERIIYGGLEAVAAPRGFGKDTLAEIALIWGVLFGHIRFGVFACYEYGEALNRIETIKAQFECNRWLMEDFPEVCAPARALERAAQRAKQQTYNGKFTRIEWGKDMIIMPTIKGSKASGAIIAAGSLSGSIRGMNVNGRRPSFVIITDPQTAEVAKSPTQIEEVLRKINSDFGGLGAVDRAMAALALVTVIRRHDVADQLTDPSRNPQWNGRRFGAIKSWPDRMDLWDQYEMMLETGVKESDSTGRAACRFYQEHRADMDAGAETAWEHAFIPTKAADGSQMELSALQHFMNLRWRWGEEAFLTEYQNEPSNGPQTTGLTAELVASRLSLFPHVVAPVGSRLIQSIDVGGREVHYQVNAYNPEDGSAMVIDYDILKVAAPEGANLRDLDGATKQALERALLETLRGRRDELRREVTPYRDMDGNPLEVSLTLIDSGWGALTEAIYLFTRESGPKWRSIKGHQAEPGNTKYNSPKSGMVGDHWHAVPIAQSGVMLFHLDADYWKQHVHERFLQSEATPGAWTLYGRESREHKLFSRHIVAEEWDVQHGRFNKISRYNHFLDTAAYNAAGASMLGIRILGQAKAAMRVTIGREVRKGGQSGGGGGFTMPGGRPFVSAGQ